MALAIKTKSIPLKQNNTTFKFNTTTLKDARAAKSTITRESAKAIDTWTGPATKKELRRTYFRAKRRGILPTGSEYAKYVAKGVGSKAIGLGNIAVKGGYAVGMSQGKAPEGANSEAYQEGAKGIEFTKTSTVKTVTGTKAAANLIDSKVHADVPLDEAKRSAFSPSLSKRTAFNTYVKKRTGAYVKLRAKNTAPAIAARKYAARLRASKAGQMASKVYNHNFVKAIRMLITRAVQTIKAIVVAIAQAIMLIFGTILPIIIAAAVIAAIIGLFTFHKQQAQKTTYSWDNVPPILTDEVIMGAIWLEDEYGIPASVTLGQLIQESGTTPSLLAKNDNNLFGVKGTGDAGSASYTTFEYYDGVRVTIVAKFAKYSSVEAAMKARGIMLTEWSIYSKHTKGCKTPLEWITAIKAAGYATDPNYVEHVMNVINYWDLTRFDGGSNSPYLFRMVGVRDENGIPKVPLIRQANGLWNNETQSWDHTDWPSQWYSEGTLATSGCGICSEAMAFSYFSGEIINPIKLASAGRVIYNNMVPIGNANMKTNYKYDFNISWDEAVNALKKGNMVIALMDSTTCPGFSKYTGNNPWWPLNKGGAHFILLIGIDKDGNIAVNDPGSKYNVSYWYKNQKTTIPQSMIKPAFCGYGSTILYTPEDLVSSKVGNPYGNSKFYITDVALAWRDCPFHGWELHDGWDLALGGNGTPIYAVTPGQVVVAGRFQGYGNHVVVIKSGKMYVLYGHMSEMHVKVGDMVQTGNRIGSQGSEGYSTGPHLHLEFRKGDLYGTSTANKDSMIPMLKDFANNFSSYTSTIHGIVR